MMNVKKQYMLSTLGIIVFVFLLSVVAPRMRKQELLFGLAIMITLGVYFVMLVCCGRQTKKEYHRNQHNDWELLCIRVTYYGVILSLLLNVPMILVLISYLLQPELLIAIFGTFARFENVVSLFIVPWGLFLIVMLFQIIVSFIFLGQFLMIKMISASDANH